MPTRKILIRLTVCVILAFLLVAPSSASHILGVKVVVTGTDVPSLTAEVDMTVYVNETVQTTETSEWNTQYSSGGETFYPISWGEGEVSTHVTLEGVASSAPGIFRSSFSHSYESTGPFTVRVASDCCPSGDSGEWITGNAIPSGEAPSQSRGGDTFFTNTAEVSFADTLAIPTVGAWGLILLSALLVGGGVLLLRR